VISCGQAATLGETGTPNMKKWMIITDFKESKSGGRPIELMYVGD